MTFIKRIVFLALLFVVGCGGNSAEISAPLEGVWLSPIETGGYQGFQFDADGRVHYLNMLSITGDRWQRVGEAGLNISSHTDHYPQPEMDQMLIKELSAQRLVLVPDDNPKAPGNTYQRFSPENMADIMVGRWLQAEDTFFDITPAGQGYRVVFKWPQGMQTLNGKPTDEGISASLDGKVLNLILAPGPDDSGLCLHIDGRIFSCRSGL